MTTHLVRRHKLTKRQIKEDPLVTAAFRVREFWEAYGQRLLIALGALIVVLVLGYLILRARAQAEERATGDYFKAELSYQQGDYPSAIQVLTELIDNAPDTRAAHRAMILLGDSYAAQGKSRDAVTWYRKAVDHAGNNPVIKVGALYGLASALEDGGQFAEAAANYGKVVEDVKTDNERGRAMFDQARCLLAAGQRAKASEVLKGILMLPNADLSVTQPARERLGELGATPPG
jgi:TolA-binding protein